MASNPRMPDVTFGHAVLAFPIALALHVFEEWPGFPRWARRFASDRYSDDEYVRVHVFAVALATVSSLLASTWPTPWVVLPFLTVVFLPAVACNAVFHAAASLRSRTYCPGTITGLVVYLPLAAVLGHLAVRDGIVSASTLLAMLAVAASVHVAEVGHNVFKAW